MYISIPNFESLSKQEMFDISVKHVLKNGRPSMDVYGKCYYSGIGCAAAPFIQEDKRKEADDKSWSGLSFKGHVPKHENYFVRKLQRCHDAAIFVDEEFINKFKENALNLAKEYNLDSSALNS